MRPMFAALALNVLGIGACAAVPGLGGGPPPEPAEEAGVIVAACGGGFSGGAGGVTITVDNHVVRWRQATAGAPRMETDLGQDAAFAESVRTQLRTIGFADTRYSDTGNMTCSLSVGAHSVSWSMGNEAGAPSGVRDLQRRVLAADGRQ